MRGRARAFVLAVTTLGCAAAVAGCGGEHGRDTVQLTLTAPTDGALVDVRELAVLGTVQPQAATVLVQGARAAVRHGVFRRWIRLHKGVVRIRIRAAAAGYRAATMYVSVRSASRAYGDAGSTQGRHSAVPASTDSPVGTGEYPASLENRMYTSCQLVGGAPRVCRCRLMYIERHTPVSTLLRSSYALLRGSGPLPKWAIDATVHCGD